MFHLLISFGWINIFSVQKNLYSWVPWISFWVGAVSPQLCWVSAAHAKQALLASLFTCWVLYSTTLEGTVWRGKNHLWLAVAWHDLACQLPHKPVVPPLGSSTQVWELIILGQEKQLHNNKRKQANETKQNPRKPPNKQVNLRKVYCHLTLPFVPLGCTALLLLPAPARRMAGKRVSVCKKRVILLLTDTAQSSPTADLSTLIKQMAPGGRTWRCSLFCLHGLATIQLLFVL